MNEADVNYVEVLCLVNGEVFSVSDCEQTTGLYETEQFARAWVDAIIENAPSENKFQVFSAMAFVNGCAV